jgi:hypothetical protein
MNVDQPEILWGYLAHLGFNMWLDRPRTSTSDPTIDKDIWFSDTLRFDDRLWADLTEELARSGFTMVVMDLADGVRYDSHPEIAVQQAWSPRRLANELTRLRQLGLEPIPKLNFSASHDAWLRQYGRQVSTEPYYRVAADLIAEVSALFDAPRFFHLGMDEERIEDQRNQESVTLRQFDLWWHDLEFLIAQVQRSGARAWVWSDHAWRHPVDFYRRMPTSVVQSNWYYYREFASSGAGRPRLLDGPDRYLAYLDLAEHGYDQIPTGSNWFNPENFELTVDFCESRIASPRRLGYLQTSWRATVEEHRATHFEAIRVAAAAMNRHAAALT